MTIAVKVETVKRYRIKFVLADGRNVYTSRRGQVEEKTVEELAAIDLTQIAGHAAYSSDLVIFSPDYSIFERMGVPYTMVTDVITEDTALPADPTALTQSKRN